MVADELTRAVFGRGRIDQGRFRPRTNRVVANRPVGRIRMKPLSHSRSSQCQNVGDLLWNEEIHVDWFILSYVDSLGAN